MRLPALRERRDDVGRLFYHFLADEREALEDTTCPTAEDERAMTATGRRPRPSYGCRCRG